GGDLACAQNHADHDGHRPDAHAFGGRAGDQENCGSDLVQSRSEAAVNKLICREHLAAKILGRKKQADDHAAGQVSEDYLEKTEVAGIGHARRADDRERAGLRADDRERDGPPGDVAIGKKVVAERTLRLAKAESKKSNADQIRNDDGSVYDVQWHLVIDLVRPSHYSKKIVQC